MPVSIHSRRAVLDVGSNSVLLTLCEFRDDQWVQIQEETDVTALGEGTKETGLLGQRGMTATLKAVKGFFEIARSKGAEVTGGVTMAARIASNSQDFLNHALAQGTPLSILSGEDEAQLGFESVASDPLFSQADRLSIVDPGGHSTELITADRVSSGWKIHFKRSYPLGTLGLKSTLLPSESTDSLTVLRAIVEIDALIGLRYRPGQNGKAVVLGATGTNLVSIREQLTEWNPKIVHGAILDYEEVSKAVGWMMPLSDIERATIPGMEKGREKTVHLGALILERFLFALGSENCSVSVRGWRHAVIESDTWFQRLLSTGG